MTASAIPDMALSGLSEGEPRLKSKSLGKVHRRISCSKGLTLIEVTIAVGLLSISLLGILGGLLYTYQTAAGVRYHDNAHVILKSLGDQFLVLPAQTTTGGFKPMWTNTTSSTGIGLTWEDSDGTTTTTVNGLAGGLTIHLGTSSGNPIEAVITRDVRYLNGSGQIVNTIASSSAGYLLLGEFTITYSYRDKPYSQTMSLVRAWP